MRRSRMAAFEVITEGLALINTRRCAQVDVLLVRKRSCPWTPHRPEYVYGLYRQRGDDENRIKELHDGLDLD